MATTTIVAAESKANLARNVAILSVKLPPSGTITKYATFLMPDQVQDKAGVRGEAILGRLKDPSGPVAPDNFVQNRDFVRFLQDVIARHAATCPPLAAEAARVGKGLVYVLDGRRDPAGQPSPEDILGTALVEDGKVTAYEPARAYSVLTRNGFLHLEDWLHQRLIEELLALPVAKITIEQITDAGA
jgi:hypothetical protein